MIPVFYDERMLAKSQSYSPSGTKPRLVVEDWLLERSDVVQVVGCAPANRDELTLVHSHRYVDGVLDGSIDNGFANRSPDVARSLPWTVGSMLTAARWAVGRGRGSVAISPTSGFHHAHFNQGRGYCTFNGLMVAAASLLRSGQVRRVGILDCDFHYGDGTADILDRMPGLAVVHRSSGLTCGATSSPLRFMAWLNRALLDMLDCDLVLYQAGADMHIDDPLGGLLTTSQMAARDRMVFKRQAQYGFPLVWNLAGGYQRDLNGDIPKVVELHRQTLDACVNARVTA